MAHLEESANGGHNWHVIPLPPLEQIDSVQVMPGGVIHLTGLPVPAGSGMDKFYADVFFTSHDDGQHWDIVSHSFLTSPVHVDFVDRWIGYGRAPWLSLKMANQDVGLLITSDGGRQWTNVNLSSLGDTGSNTLAAYPGGIVFAGEINTSSANSTRTFQPVGILVQADASLSHVTAYHLGQWLADDLTFTSHTDGWLALNGHLFHTADGGKRFNEVYVVQ